MPENDEDAASIDPMPVEDRQRAGNTLPARINRA
jgi:hypothetical protein